MNAYLLTWNPEYYPSKELQTGIEHIRKSGYWDEDWSCGVRKSMPIGSQVYLMRVGTQPKGIIASGVVTREPYKDKHWLPARAKRGEEAMYCGIRFRWLAVDPLLPLEQLENIAEQRYNWLPRASGQRIPEDIAGALEELVTEIVSV